MSGLAARPLKPLIGSAVRIDAAALIGGAHAAALRALLIERGVVLFRDLDITLDQQRAITAGLGRLRTGDVQKVTIDAAESPEYAAYFPMTFFWHYDGNYADAVPCLGASMRPARLAGMGADGGGETEFLNAYAAYEGLSESDRRLVDSLRVVHTRVAANAVARPEASDAEAAAWRRFAPATQPLVWEHASGRKSLLLRSSVSHVEGMHPADSHDLLCRLRCHMAREEYVYRHTWRMGDLLLWDNTGTLHRARPFDPRSGRLLHRFTLEGEEPIRAPAAA